MQHDEDIPTSLRPQAEAAVSWINETQERNYELTGLVDYERLTPAIARQYRELGVDVLYILPISLDTGPVLQQMRDYADLIGEIN